MTIEVDMEKLVAEQLNNAEENGYLIHHWSDEDIAADLQAYSEDFAETPTEVLLPLIAAWKKQPRDNVVSLLPEQIEEAEVTPPCEDIAEYIWGAIKRLPFDMMEMDDPYARGYASALVSLGEVMLGSTAADEDPRITTARKVLDAMREACEPYESYTNSDDVEGTDTTLSSHPLYVQLFGTPTGDVVELPPLSISSDRVTDPST